MDGKRVLKSLKTDDVFLAVHRLHQALAVTFGQKEQSTNKTTDTTIQPANEQTKTIQPERSVYRYHPLQLWQHHPIPPTRIDCRD